MRTSILFPAILATVVATLPGAAQATSTTCTTSTVCAEYINTYTSSSPVTGGVAIHGEANGGIGIRGTSVSNVGFYGASGSGSYLAPGVEGESTNNGTTDAGAGFGLAYFTKNTAPYVGALGLGSRAGFAGTTTSPGTSTTYTASGYGVIGQDGIGAASASGDFNAGVAGKSTYGTSVLALSSGSPTQAVFGMAPIGIYSVANVATGTPTSVAVALLGESDSFGLVTYNTAENTLLAGDYQTGYLIGEPSPGLTSKATGRFQIDYTGSETLSGSLTTSKGTYVRTTGGSGAVMREYETRSTVPNVEDFGDGQLVNGRAYVPIDARLADTIDRRVEYHVFVTPEGDCKGLYVTQKSPGGFAVRELQGGRSSLAFEYRIVAKPIDENGTRLAAMPADTPSKLLGLPAGNGANTKGTTPLSIEAELRQRLGPQGYAKAIAALNARLAGR